MSTFYINRIKAGRAGESWFLLSGKVIGDTGSRLHLQVVGFDGKALQSVWEESGLRRTYLAGVFGDHIVLKGSGLDAKGREIEFTERLDVVAEGLKRVTRHVEHPPKAMRPETVPTKVPPALNQSLQRDFLP